jgi:molybdate/tungstate transport system substrate-binding protein
VFPLLSLLLLAASPATSSPLALDAQFSGPLSVFNAGSLAHPFRALLAAFVREHPAVRPTQESSGSLEAVRKLTELGKIPDVLAVADHNVIAKLLLPDRASWYVGFASNAMVLAYSTRSAAAASVSGDNWWEILLRPGVRWGISNPALDPNGYRAHMVFQLAERHYRRPGLARRLEAAVRSRYVRPSEAQLLGLVQAGELDYAWSYRSLATTAGLRWVSLPSQIDLSDPARAEEYASARVRLPGSRLGSADSVEFRGEPILYALTIPTGAAHPELGRAFVQFVLSDRGQEILRQEGFVVLDRPRVIGKPPFAVKVDGR